MSVVEPKNKYYIRSKISEAKFRELVRLFALDLETVKIAALTGISRNHTTRILGKIRRRIAEVCETQATLSGIIEVDESYFGPRRTKGKRGRGAGGKTIVFGLIKRGGNVYAQIVPDCAKPTLQAIIRGKVELGSIVNTDGFKAYDGLVDLGYAKHLRVKHGENQFAHGKAHINGIESFWGYAKTRLAKMRGVHKKTFEVYLKECEWRFNNRTENLYKLLLKMLRENPLRVP